MTNAFIPNDDAIAHAQRTILAALQQGPVSTIECRESLGIQAPAPRILELRRRGFNIATQRRRVIDEHGRGHTVAVYCLVDETESEGGDHD